MELQETDNPNTQHLEKIRADIDADQAKMDELDKRIKGRTILGFSLPGTEVLREERRKTELAWRFSVAEESSTMSEVTHDNAARALQAESAPEAETETEPADAAPEAPDSPESK